MNLAGAVTGKTSGRNHTERPTFVKVRYRPTASDHMRRRPCRPYCKTLGIYPVSDESSDHPHSCQRRIIGLVFFGEVIHRIEDQIDEISGVLRAFRPVGDCFQ